MRGRRTLPGKTLSSILSSHADAQSERATHVQGSQNLFQRAGGIAVVIREDMQHPGLQRVQLNTFESAEDAADVISLSRFLVGKAAESEDGVVPWTPIADQVYLEGGA